MKKYIYVNYYSDSDERRREENLRCVNSNLGLSWIDGVIIFLENPDCRKDIADSNKITFVDISKRMEFRDAVEHADCNLPPDSVFIIVNLDIMLEDSEAWHNIDRDFFKIGHPKKAMVCKRHNLASDGSLWIEEYSWRKGEFCDAYVMTTPIDPGLLNEDLGFCVGNAPQCDNTMMHLMSKYYHVFSWGSKYRIMHLDIARRKNTRIGMITNSKTDPRPGLRKTEHIDIPAYQDWDRLLKEAKEPLKLPTWRMHEISFRVNIPKI